MSFCIKNTCKNKRIFLFVFHFIEPQNIPYIYENDLYVS